MFGLFDVIRKLAAVLTGLLNIADHVVGAGEVTAKGFENSCKDKVKLDDIKAVMDMEDQVALLNKARSKRGQTAVTVKSKRGKAEPMTAADINNRLAETVGE